MPGYYAHLATVNPVVSKNRSFIYGVEMPDLLKDYYYLYGFDYTKEKYNSIQTIDMPNFSLFEELDVYCEKSTSSSIILTSISGLYSIS